MGRGGWLREHEIASTTLASNAAIRVLDCLLVADRSMRSENLLLSRVSNFHLLLSCGVFKRAAVLPQSSGFLGTFQHASPVRLLSLLVAMNGHAALVRAIPADGFLQGGDFVVSRLALSIVPVPLIVAAQLFGTAFRRRNRSVLVNVYNY